MEAHNIQIEKRCSIRRSSENNTSCHFPAYKTFMLLILKSQPVLKEAFNE